MLYCMAFARTLAVGLMASRALCEDRSLGKLTTHVLDTRSGKPAAGMRIELFVIDGDARVPITAITTNVDGRAGGPMLDGDDLHQGVYELEFHAGDYYRGEGVDLEDPAFLERVSIRFGVSDPASHYHVPLLLTPWSYSTYRGS